MTEINKDEVTINDLINNEASTDEVKTTVRNTDMEEMKELNISDIAPYEVKEDPVQRNVAELLDKVDKAVDNRMVRDDAYIEEKLAEIEEKRLDEEIESDDGDAINNDMYTDDDSFFEDLKPEGEADDKENDKQLDTLKNTIKEKIKPVTDTIDLSSFTISKKHVAVTKTLTSQDSTKHVADWVLLAAKKPISMSEFTGYEIGRLNPASSSRNRYNTYYEIYNMIYSHVVDNNKPPFDIWIKGISFFDIPHLYFTIYKACFEGVNSIPYACTNKDCNHVFMNEYNVNDMIKYVDDKVKELVDDILNNNSTDSGDNPEDYEAELVQISNNYVVSFREPTIWNIIFENAILDEKFTDKYSDFLGIMVYIDEVYYINRETNDLEPIQVEVDPKNMMKTIKSRIVKYSEVLKSLNSDQFQFLQAYIKKINDRYEGVTYILPEATCPKCGAIIKEQNMEPDSLLFTRHQLAAIANI